MQVWTVLVENFFQQFVPSDGSVLDVGCGYGEFINLIKAAKKFAIDLNPDSKARVDAKVTLFTQSCADPWPVASDSLDVVFTSNFLEHLPSKVHISQTLAEAFRCLRPGGRILCLGPNIRYLPGAYWDFFDHHIPLSERSLVECLQTEGFQPVRVESRFLPYTMANSRPTPALLVRTYLKLRFVWPLFGKQFLVVAKKPG
jgi:SAM-dependent methyltransferase